MKKLKATDVIKVESKLHGIITFHRDSNLDMYMSEEKFGLFEIPLFISLDQINKCINDGLYILIKGEYEKDEELKEEKREDGNKVSEVKNNIVKNENVEDKKVVSGLDILNDIYNNKNNSKYYNCKLKFVGIDKFFRIIKNGVIYIDNTGIELTQSDMLYFMNSEFTLVKEEKEVTWQEAIEILTNQSDKYDVYFVDSGNHKIEMNRNSHINIGSIATSIWYVVEK